MTKYLFRRPGSSNWWIKLYSPSGRVEQSLGTSDYREAEEIAHRGFTLPDGSVYSIGAHKAALRAARPTLVTVRDYKLEPGREHAGPDGTKIVATEKDLIHLGHNGSIIKIEPNGELRRVVDFKGGPVTNARFEAALTSRPAPAKRKVVDSDDAIFETYLKHAGVTGYREREAQDMWDTFKSVVGKPLRECTRDDGRAIVAHMIDQGEDDEPLKSATLRRKLVPLVAAVNLAIDEGKMAFNPFHKVVGKQGAESDARRKFTDEDMVLIRDNLHKLSPEDALLVRVLATTGVRRGEAFEIASEQPVDNGIRYCVVGTKTDASLRRLPFPEALLPYLPNPITKPLFTGRLDSASKRLRTWLTDDCKITDPNKAPMHSFRHRAKWLLENAEPPLPDKLINAVGGWSTRETKKNSGDDYGKNPDDNAVFKIAKVKAAIDQIGF